MTPEQAALIWDTLRTVGVGGILAAIIFVLYKRWYISKAESDDRVAGMQAQVDLLKEQLEKREGLYIASLAEMRTAVKEGAETRERVQGLLDENIKQMYRFADVLGDLRDAIRAIQRGSP